MNRFEALHTLGLEETASDEDIRLAYYGIERAVDPEEFSDIEAVKRSAQGLRDRAKQARDFLLNEHNKAAARQVMAKGGKKQKQSKLSVTATEEKTARLKGTEKLRSVVLAYLDEQRSHLTMSILVIVLCIVLSFIVLRYVRAMQPRIVIFGVIAIAAIVSSTTLTTSLMQVRKSKVHMIEVDARIDALKAELGISDEEAGEDPAALPPADDEEDAR